MIYGVPVYKFPATSGGLDTLFIHGRDFYYPGIGIGWGWGPGINLGFYFGGCCGWGGWGWGFGWFGGGIVVNNHFFHRYGFQEFHGSQFHANSAWVHNPEHRGAVPYPHAVAGRYPGAAGAARGAARPNAEAVRSNLSRPSGQSNANQAHPNNHSAFGGSENRQQGARQSDHGYSSMGAGRSSPYSSIGTGAKGAVEAAAGRPGGRGK